jgi:hypothetical protein
MNGNRDLAELARERAAGVPPGSLDRRAWGCVAVALSTTSTVPAAARVLGAVHPPDVQAAARKHLANLDRSHQQ